MSFLTSSDLLFSASGASLSAEAFSSWSGSGGAGEGVEAAGELGEGSVWTGCAGAEVEISVFIGVALDAVGCLLFDFKGVAAESVNKKDVGIKPQTKQQSEISTLHESLNYLILLDSGSF